MSVTTFILIFLFRLFWSIHRATIVVGDRMNKLPMFPLFILSPKETERRNNTGIRDAWKTPPVTPVKNVARIDFNVRHDNYSTDDVSCDTHQLVMNSQQCDTHIVTSTPLMEQRGNTFTSRWVACLF